MSILQISSKLDGLYRHRDADEDLHDKQDNKMVSGGIPVICISAIFAKPAAEDQRL